MSTNLLVIVNPRARSGGAARQHAAVREATEQRLSTLPEVSGVDWIETRFPAHATQLAQAAAEKGCRYIFAAGGDGTISEVLNGIMRAPLAADQRPIFGVLPWGTLNDFYRALAAADAARPPGSYTQPLDVGHVFFDTLERYCCLSISIGLSSWANMQYQQVSRRLGRVLAALPSALVSILTYKQSPGVLLTLDDQPPQTRQMLAIAVSNCATVGGGVRLTPDAQIDDGLFDLCIIQKVPLWRLAFVLSAARLHLRYRSAALELTRAREISITSEQPFSVHLDGELIPKVLSQVRSLRVQVLPGALNVVRPSCIGLLNR